MFKNIYVNSFLNKMKGICNVCLKPTNLTNSLKFVILIKKCLLSLHVNILFSDKKYNNTLIVPLDNFSKVMHIQGNLALEVRFRSWKKKKIVV